MLSQGGISGRWNLWLLLLTTISAGLSSSVARAGLMSFEFYGTLNLAYHMNGDGSGIVGVSGGVGAGDSYVGSVTFDDQAALFDQAAGSRYSWKQGTVSIKFGGVSYSFTRYNTPGKSQLLTLRSPSSFGISAQDGTNPSNGDHSQIDMGFSIAMPFESLATLAGNWNPSSFASRGSFMLIQTFAGRPSENYVIDAWITGVSAIVPVAGSTQASPRLPDFVNSKNQYSFINVPTGLWFDPPLASGFEYKMTTPGSLFTAIHDFPTGFTQPFTVASGGVILGTGRPGDTFLFPGGGVSEFEILGIQPLVDPANTSAFPLQLDFNTPTASFTMSPVTVPEPSGLIMGTFAVLFLFCSRQAMPRTQRIQ